MKKNITNIIRVFFILIWLIGIILMVANNSELLFVGLLFSLLIIPVALAFIRENYGVKILNSFLEKTGSYLFYICLLIIALIGGGIVIYQIYNYLKTGTWLRISIINAFVLFENKWAINPNDWGGLWAVLNKTPLSISLISFSFGLFYAKETS